MLSVVLVVGKALAGASLRFLLLYVAYRLAKSIAKHWRNLGKHQC